MQELQFDPEALVSLVPLCVEVFDKYKAKEEIDVRDTANRVGVAFGIDDVEAFAKDAMQAGLGEGFAFAMNAQQADDLARIFTDAAKPAAEVIVKYAKGEASAADLGNTLDGLCSGNAQAVQDILQQALGIPDETAEKISAKLGAYTVSVYCFAATAKIYMKASEDAAMAREYRQQVQTQCAEAIAQLKVRRQEMQQLVDTYMLARVPAFNDGVMAMDQAVLADDDDGFIRANADLWEVFGRPAQYRTAEEFDDLMLSDQAFKL